MKEHQCARERWFQTPPEGARGVWVLADTRVVHRLFFCCPHECVSVHQRGFSLPGRRAAAAPHYYAFSSQCVINAAATLTFEE